MAGELYRCKNGPLALRQRYAQAKELFNDLTGRALGVQVSPDSQEPGTVLIDVTVVDGDHEVPIAFAGAGTQEALLLSTLLTGESGRAIVLVDILPALKDGDSRLAAGGDRLGLRVGSPFNGPCLAWDFHSRTDRPSRGV